MTLTLKTNMLAFSRSLEVSDGLMQAGFRGQPKESLVPVEVRRIGVRGQTSNATSKTEKENWGSSNPQRIDVATMPPGKDMLQISFTLRVLANSLKPFSTDSFDAVNSYRKLAESFESAGGYCELGHRYISNIANGRFAWRNFSLADESDVTVSWQVFAFQFDPARLSRNRLQPPPAPVPANPYAGVQEMGVALRAKGKNNPIEKPAMSLYDILAKPTMIEADMRDNKIGPEYFFVMANLVRGGVFGDKG